MNDIHDMNTYNPFQLGLIRSTTRSTKPIKPQGRILLSIKVPNGPNTLWTLYGGSYLKAPPTIPGINLAAEIDKPCAIRLPIHDFSIPYPTDMEIAIYQSIGVLIHHQQLYAGCMGGYGRTGTFLACLIKTMSVLYDEFLPVAIHDSIRYIRTHYHPRAVETDEQIIFVDEFNPYSITDELYHSRIRLLERSAENARLAPSPHG